MTYMTQGLHRALQAEPERTATICQGRVHTFQQFAERVAKLAGALQRIGMQSDDSVAILSLNSDRYLEYFCGVPWGGGMLNPCNIRWSAAELVHSLNDAGSTILIVDDAFKDLAQRIRGETPNIRHMVYAGDGATPDGMLSYEAMLAEAEPVEDVRRGGDELLGIFYTGGTTGFPKGVMLSHGNVWAASMQLLGAGFLPKGSTCLEVAPLFHIGGMAIMYATLLMGNTHVVVPAFSPVAVLDAVAKYRVTDVMMVPTMLQMLVDHPDFKKYDVSCLERVVYGASAISEGVLNRVMAGFPGAHLVQGYGQTELAGVCTLLGAEYHTDAWLKQGRLRSAGRASLCVELRIVDTEENEVPRGTVGEVVIRGPNVMKGYWKTPDQTSAAFTGDRWLRTGDAAYMDDEGFIFIVDRIKDMIVTGAENVFSAEVENAVSKHPSVAMCAVIGIPSEQWGESVHAVVVLRPGMTASEDEIKEHCRQSIAGYKCPRSIEFRDQLPLSGAGKVLKRALREPFWQGQSRRVA